MIESLQAEYLNAFFFKNLDVLTAIFQVAKERGLNLDINAHADITNRGFYRYTPLMLAAHTAEDQLEWVKMLVENGADPKLVDREGNTALHFAVQYGYVDILKILLISDGNVNIENIC